MTVTVKFFASLRERLGQAEAQIDYRDGLTVNDAWQQASNNAEMPANTLCAVNMDYVDSSHTVADGDEVAFFPPVTGG